MDLYLSIPLEDLENGLEFAASHGFKPEIRMTYVDRMTSISRQELERLRSLIDGRGFRPFTHGPFFGLDVASLDRNISEYSIRSLIHGLEITAALGAGLMVMHTGYLPQFSRGGRRHWFKNWGERMPQIIEKASSLGVRIALENTWDDRPEVLLHLAGMLPGPDTGFCIDTGHVNAFSRLSFSKWWNALGSDVAAMHIHDNDGISDDHMIPGRGTFDFRAMADLVSKSTDPPLLDLEVDRRGADEAKRYIEGVFSGRL